jgi:hypothetical protein
VWLFFSQKFGICDVSKSLLKNLQSLLLNMICNKAPLEPSRGPPLPPKSMWSLLVRRQKLAIPKMPFPSSYHDQFHSIPSVFHRWFTSQECFLPLIYIPKSGTSRWQPVSCLEKEELQ